MSLLCLGVELGFPDPNPEHISLSKPLSQSCLGPVIVAVSSFIIRPLVVHLALQKHLRDAPTLSTPVFTRVSRIRASRNEE